MSDLRGKSAVITGSTSGIGKEIARAFAKAGVNITLNGFGDAAEIEAQRAGLEKEYGIRAIYDPADMTKPKQIKDMVRRTVKEFGSVDILVNNAGIQYVAPIEKFPDRKWKKIIETNLSSVFYATKTAIPHMKKQRRGRIINIASVHGLVASIDKTAYVTAKHGVVGLTKGVALEAGPYGITCNAICPGWVETPLAQKQINAYAEKHKITLDEAKKEMLAPHATGNPITVEEISSTALFLCSYDARNITGATISIDAGWTAGRLPLRQDPPKQKKSRTLKS